jgi:hypothetical protein
MLRRMECPRCRTGPHHLHHDTRLGIGHNLMPLVDSQPIPYPSRYSDPRGEEMWKKIQEILNSEPQMELAM